jgi:hypothetical protein
LSRRRTLAVALATAGCSLSVLPAEQAGAARLTLGDRDLRAGMSGRDVRVLQDFLTRVGLTTPVDGAYGPFTSRRVKSWERRSERRVKPAAASPGPGENAVIDAAGRAIAPESAPEAVKAVIAAANRIVDKPYKYGGGHGRWEDSGYDCSGSMSYALHGAGLLDRALTSGDFSRWAEPGKGQWITTYGSGGHSYMVVAGLRFDTGWNDSSSDGPSWSEKMRPTSGYTARHPAGL